jgi:hypothetical protein
VQSSEAKKKSAINKHRRQTGGGEESSQKLNAFEDTVTILLGQVPIEGHPNTEESLVINFLHRNNDLDFKQPINILKGN